MNQERSFKLDAMFPHHSAEISDRKAYFAAIAAIAAEFTEEELREARQAIVDLDARNPGVEFGDNRAAHIDAVHIKLLGKAMGLLGAKDAEKAPKPTGAIDWVKAEKFNASYTAEINGKVYFARVVRKSFPYSNYWELLDGNGEVVRNPAGSELPKFISQFR